MTHFFMPMIYILLTFAAGGGVIYFLASVFMNFFKEDIDE